MNTGDNVKMTDEFVTTNLNDPNIKDHIKEFKDCNGIVIEVVDDFAEVRWEPSGLRYAYHISNLESI